MSLRVLKRRQLVRINKYVISDALRNVLPIVWSVYAFCHTIFATKLPRPKHLIHDHLEIMRLVVINRDPDAPVLGQQIAQQFQPRVHHRQPLAVLQVVVVVLEGALGVVGRVDEDALHPPGVERQQGLQALPGCRPESASWARRGRRGWSAVSSRRYGTRRAARLASASPSQVSWGIGVGVQVSVYGVTGKRKRNRQRMRPWAACRVRSKPLSRLERRSVA